MTSLSTVTREAVLAAIAEYDKLGEVAFLKRYLAQPGRYMLVWQRRQYHSKAIFAAAMNRKPSTFSGGAASVQRAATRLGFKVEKRAP